MEILSNKLFLNFLKKIFVFNECAYGKLNYKSVKYISIAREEVPFTFFPRY